jgi:hypothetical protein
VIASFPKNGQMQLTLVKGEEYYSGTKIVEQENGEKSMIKYEFDFGQYGYYELLFFFNHNCMFAQKYFFTSRSSIQFISDISP